jgi:transcriptional regulator with XRE-family HTH domain
MTFTKPTARRWGEAIRKARLDLGLSVFGLASATGIDPGHLSRAERGLAGIGDDYRAAIAEALGKPHDELFSDDPENACPSAASATGADTSPTPASPPNATVTRPANPSSAPSATDEDASTSGESRNE